MISPLVSVIIPNYNHAKYLDQRIQSVLSQTYLNFEVIILDDCSPDNGASKAVIEKYRGNPHITHIVYNDENSGSTFSQWRKGFELASGELVWIAESDDYCKERFLEVLVRPFINNKDITFSYTTSVLVDSENKEIEDSVDIATNIPEGIYQGTDFIRKYMICGNSVWNASAVVFRKDTALGLDRMYVNYKAAGDHLFWILLAEHGDVCLTNCKLNFFRQHTQKVTQSKMSEGVTIKELYKTVCYLRKKGYLKWKDELRLADYYIHLINITTFNNPDMRSELVKLWNFHGLFNRVSLKVLRVLLNYA